MIKNYYNNWNQNLSKKINWNKYQSKVTTRARNQYLDYLIDPSFHGVNTFFVLSFEDNAHQTRHTRYFLPTVKIEEENVIINGKNFSWSNSKKWSKIIW